MGHVLSGKEILEALDIRKEWVPLPEWGAANGSDAGLYIKALSAREREEWEDAVTDTAGNRVVGNVMAEAIVRAAVDAEGHLIFAAGQGPALSGKIGSAILRMWQTFKKLNIVTEDDVRALVGNLPSGINAASSSDSPSPADSLTLTG